MAAEAMEVNHDRRLSISKSSSAKISKSSSSSSSSSSAPPPSAISAAPSPLHFKRSDSAPPPPPPPPPSANSRPIAKIVNADPSSFRRVVQELTGTAAPPPPPPSSAASPSPSPSPPSLSRQPSRLQRIAPPPLRSSDPNRSLLQQQQQQLLLLQQQQQQQQQQRAFFHPTPPYPTPSSNPPRLLDPNPNPNPNPNHYPSPSFPLPSSSSHHFPSPLFLPHHLNPRSNLLLLHQQTDPNPSHCSFASSDPSLPMLSPHLLSPLPALSPSDHTWANPLDAASPKASSFNTLPPPSSLPSIPSHGVFQYSNSHSALNYSQSHGFSSANAAVLNPTNNQNISMAMANAQNLVASPASPSAAASITWSLPPWSPSVFPSPPPFSPAAIYPASPPPAMNTGTAALFSSIKSTSMSPTNTSDFSFRGPSTDYSNYRPSF